MLFWGENTSAVVSFEVCITFKLCLELLMQLEKYIAMINTSTRLNSVTEKLYM